jgi:hypothetical protein
MHRSTLKDVLDERDCTGDDASPPLQYPRTCHRTGFFTAVNTLIGVWGGRVYNIS